MPRYDIREPRESSRDRKFRQFSERRELSNERTRLGLAQQQANQNQLSSSINSMRDLFEISQASQLAPEQLRALQMSNQAKEFDVTSAPQRLEAELAQSGAATGASQAQTALHQAQLGYLPREFALKEKEAGATVGANEAQAALYRERAKYLPMESYAQTAGTVYPQGMVPEEVRGAIFGGQNPAPIYERNAKITQQAQKAALLEDFKRDVAWWLDPNKRAMAMKVFSPEEFAALEAQAHGAVSDNSPMAQELKRKTAHDLAKQRGIIP